MANRSDNFNRANNASSLGTPSDAGSAWSALSGTWGIDSNQGYASAVPGGGYGVAVLETSDADGEVEVTLTTTGASQGIVIRATDDNNYIVLFTDNFFWSFYKKESGSFSAVGGSTGTAIAANDVLKVTFSGDVLTGYRNGAQILTTTSTFNQSATKHGLAVNQTTSRWDDFSFTVPAIPAGTTVQAGDWSDTATWSGGTIPTADAVINHAVTVDDNRSIDGMEINAALDVAAGVTFTVSGSVTQANATVTLAAGSTLALDATSADVVWEMGTAANQANCKIVANGTSGSHVTISKTGANDAYFDQDTANDDSSGWECDYTDFSGISDASGVAIDYVAVAGSPFRFWNCTFDACGTVGLPFYGTTHATNPYSLRDSIWTNSVTGSTCINPAIDAAGAAGAEILRCSFDKAALLQKVEGVTVEDNYFADMPSVNSGTPVLWRGNLIRYTNNVQTFLAFGDDSEDYNLADHTQGNPHFRGAKAGATHEWHIFDYPHPADVDPGDCFLNSAVGGATITVRNNLVLPSYSDGYSAGFVANGGGAGDWRVLHNTAVGMASVAAFVKDYAASGTIFTQVKSNLVVAPAGATATARASAVFEWDPTTAGNDVASGSGCTHNGFHTPITYTDPSNGSANYSGYNHRFPTSGTPGSNDIIADPEFVDDTRCLATWAVHKGAASSGDTLRQKLDAGLALLAATPALTRSDLIPWVRAGFAPTNATYQDAGHDGVTPGAVEYQAAGGTEPIAGSAGIVFGSSGSLTAKGSLAGTASIAFGLSAALAATGALAGSSGITFGQSADLRNAAAGQMSGTTGIAFGSSAALTGLGSMAGSADVVFAAGGNLTNAANPGAMSATAGISFGSVASLKATGALGGSAAITFGGSSHLRNANASFATSPFRSLIIQGV